MARYKLSTGLWTVNETPECSSDKEAWERLRIQLPGKYAVLYKEEEIKIPNNNEDSYVPKWNSKYGPPPIGYGSERTKLKEIGSPSIERVWMPVLEGITDDEYNVKIS